MKGPAVDSAGDERAPLTVAGMLAEARAAVPQIGVEEAERRMVRGALVVDVRERDEVDRTGTLPGAVHVPRGVLEWAADPAGPGRHPALDPAREIVVCCAVGGRSALAAAMLAGLGYARVSNLEGGVAAWSESGRALSPYINTN